jgi:catechol 2,3-dioxygenase-like lactoylglutathione lyase family enzyme
MEVLGLHHVSVNATDLDASLRFYTGVLGGTARDDRPDLGFPGAWIDLGAHQLHLLQGAAPADLGQHFAFHVADLDAAVAALRADGHVVSDPVPIGRGRQSFTHDPAGNLVELHSPG